MYHLFLLSLSLHMLFPVPQMPFPLLLTYLTFSINVPDWSVWIHKDSQNVMSCLGGLIASVLSVQVTKLYQL